MVESAKWAWPSGGVFKRWMPDTGLQEWVKLLGKGDGGGSGMYGWQEWVEEAIGVGGSLTRKCESGKVGGID